MKVSMKDLKPSAIKTQAPPYTVFGEVGFMSLTGPGEGNRREYHDDRRNLRRLHRRPVDNGRNAMDLNEGFETSISRFRNEVNPIETEHLDFLFKWILQHSKAFLKAKPDIVCWRKKLQEILCTPYEKEHGWTYYAAKLDGVVYMTSYETVSVKNQREARTRRDDLFTYWGYNFEHLMTTDPKDPVALKEPVNDYNTYHSVINSKIGSSRLLFGAEIDCLDPQVSEEPPKCYAELKTARIVNKMYRKETENFFEYKGIKWWSQNFLAGIPNIVVGFRNDAGVVTKIEELKTADIPKMVQENGRNWEHEVCLSFLNETLGAIKRNAEERKLLKVSWQPGDRFIELEEQNWESPFQFIPKWFTERSSLKI